MGIQRHERVLGLHPRPCRRHDTHSLRIVSRRRWALGLGPLPIVAVDARWRTCADGRHRSASPRFTVPTAILVTLALALVVGQGWLGWMHPVAWGLPLAFWSLWAVGRGADAVLDRRLDPVPAAHARVAARRATRAVTGEPRPNHPINRALLAVVRIGRTVRARRG